MVVKSIDQSEESITWMQTWNLWGSVRMSLEVERVLRSFGMTEAGAMSARLENTDLASSS